MNNRPTPNGGSPRTRQNYTTFAHWTTLDRSQIVMLGGQKKKKKKKFSKAKTTKQLIHLNWVISEGVKCNNMHNN